MLLNCDFALNPFCSNLEGRSAQRSRTTFGEDFALSTNRRSARLDRTAGIVLVKTGSRKERIL
jgi:hypothetical protein